MWLLKQPCLLLVSSFHFATTPVDVVSSQLCALFSTLWSDCKAPSNSVNGHIVDCVVHGKHRFV